MILTKTNTFAKTVKVQMPAEDKPDVVREGSFVAHFESIDDSTLADLQDDGIGNRVVLDRVLRRVEGIDGLNGQKLSSDEQVELVKENLISSNATVRAFFDAMSADPKRKNSRRSLAR